jgi:hopanoid C-3 methylase
MAASRILLAAAYEGGAQPISIGTVARHLMQDGIVPTCIDLFLDGLPCEDVVANADLLAISVPLFQSVAPGIELATIARKINPRGRIAMFGQHANIQAERLLPAYCDYVIRGDPEPGLVALARSSPSDGLGSGRGPTPSTQRTGSMQVSAPLGVCRPGQSAAPHIQRSGLLPPARDLLPDLCRYRYPELETLWGDGPLPRVANVETARGCHHACSYCSVFAATGRKVSLIPPAVVMEDIRQVVASGAGHIWFTDAEFFNSKDHAVGIVRSMKREFPHLTFDITTRADHILESREHIAEFRDLGCRFVTTALEYPSQRVLDAVYKELTVDQVERTIDFCQQIGLILNPTFIMFNPWVDYDELARFGEWIDRVGLAGSVSPLQYETRLYLYKGSPLLQHPDIQKLEKTEREFHYEWKHPDPRVDRLFAETVKPPETKIFKRCCIKC